MRSNGSSSAETSSVEPEKRCLTGSLTSAGLVMAAGRGLGSRAGFLALVELAELLGAQVAGTRGALHERWISHQREIGLSGVRTAPEVYVGLGVSGANFHTIGMEHAGYIIAVNPDPAARIHELAHCSIFADANLCVRELTAHVQELGQKGVKLDPAAVKAYFQEMAERRQRL